jgi:flagellar basal-body rod protein FlgB
MQVGDKTLNALAAAVKFREMRQELISSNLANAETPDYKAKVIDFEDALAQAVDLDGHYGMSASDPEHYKVARGGIEQLSPEIYEDPNGEVTPDGNTVDPEKEIVRMNENKIMYDAAVTLLNKKMGLTKYILANEK